LNPWTTVRGSSFQRSTSRHLRARGAQKRRKQMSAGSLEPAAAALLRRLQEVALRGYLPAISTGSTAIGMTLIGALGVPYSSTEKPHFRGIVVTAQRRTKGAQRNRVNLFAQVPLWALSSCKSSAQILERYGYQRDGVRRLYCSVSARRANSQGLMLRVDAEL